MFTRTVMKIGTDKWMNGQVEDIMTPASVDWREA